MIASGSPLVGVSKLRSVASDIAMLAHGNRTLGMFFKQPYSGCHSFWQKAIIVIEKQNIFALAAKDTLIAGSRDTAICLIDVSNRIRSRNFRGLIRGAVIDHNDFDPRVGLR